jgi:hypothetical protein
MYPRFLRYTLDPVSKTKATKWHHPIEPIPMGYQGEQQELVPWLAEYR